MNISAVSFGRKNLNVSSSYKSTNIYYPEKRDEVSFNKETQAKPKKKVPKVLVGLLAVLVAKNMLVPLPETSNPNDASNKDLKKLVNLLTTY